ncbi:MAG TPA: hypothetical protein VHO24_14550 [Opitutaceae bacterium]|nr:hypothetical protein [Opitutaceae bacterium]
MKSSLKTLFAVAVLGATALPMLSLAEDKPAAPPPGEGAPRGGGGGGGGGQRGGGRFTPEQQVARLEEAIGKLTDDQKTKITALYAAQREKNRAAMEGQSGPPDDAARAKMDEVRKAQRAELRALLTPEQQTKFDAMPPPGQGRGQGGGGGGRPRDGGAPKKE